MRTIVIGTAGHIDHGKSALVRALTGVDPDCLKEEKDRGITIDLGFAHLEVDGVNVAFVDVPGHERFVKNMLAGATGIDGVVLAVAADESVMPQTREHFEICRLLRVPAGIVVLTKADLVDTDTIGLVRLEVRDLVAESFLADAPVLAVSARTGSGLEEFRRELRGLAARVPVRDPHGVMRLPVDRAFSVKGFGTVVTGTVASGSVAVDDDLEVLPQGRHVKVRGLQAHGATVGQGVAGQRLAVNLAGVDVADVARGSVLCTPGIFEPTRRFDVALEVLEAVRPLRHGARVRFHQGTSELLGRVAISRVTRGGLRDAEGSTGEVPSGGAGQARLRLEEPAVLTRGDRFILRAYSPPVTIAGGAVIDPHPPRGPIRSPSGRARFARLVGEGSAAPAPPEQAVLQMLQDRSGRGLRVSELVGRAGLIPDEASALADRLVHDGRAVPAGEVLVGAEVIEQYEAGLLTLLGEFHRGQPLSDGLPREEARERLFARAHAAVFDVVLRRLSERGLLVGRDRLALASHRVSLSDDEQQALAAVERLFREAGLRPPDAGSVAAELGLAPAAVDQALRLLLRRKALVKVDVLVFHGEALVRLKSEVAALKGDGGQARVDVASFKERYGITRKYAIPLLEFLDRERVTRRVGEARVVL